MIQPQELRIGNYVYTNTPGCYYEVDLSLLELIDYLVT